jgi:hypothetical protein
MPRSRSTAHAELDELRQTVARQRTKARALDAALEVANQKVEYASRAVTDAYAAEDAKLAQRRRRQLETAEAKVLDLGHQVTAAKLRVERAQQAADRFAQEHARDLLTEREQTGGTVATELTASVRQTLTLAKAYEDERQTVDELVAAVPGATPRTDGPAPEHPWEHALRQLQRAYQETPELDPPLPRWTGLQHRQQQDDVNRRASLLRKRRLTAAEQAELERLNQALVITPPVSITNVHKVA